MNFHKINLKIIALKIILLGSVLIFTEFQKKKT